MGPGRIELIEPVSSWFVILSALAGVGPLQSLGVDSVPTFPEFSCTGDASFCNRALESGLYAADMRYGRGAAWVDVDDDGWDDLFLADSDNRWDPNGYGVSMFFLNRHDGTFEAVAATELGIDERDLISTWNGSFADYDNDGDADLLLANGGYSGVSNLAFYQNRIRDGEGFVSVTAESRISVANDDLSNWWGSSWADYDRDGWLDVVVTRTDGVAVVFHNNGDGTFDEVGPSLEVGIPMQDGKNPVWIDFDRDGDSDLYLAGMWEHAFYRNDSGEFVDVTSQIFAEPLPLTDSWSLPVAPIVFAAVAEDFNQDGFDDLYLGRYDLQDVLLLNDGSGGFRPHATDWGLDASDAAWYDVSRPFENTMGLGVGDLFDDGYPDIFIGSGNPVRAGPDLMFCNTVDDSFYRCTEQVLTSGTNQLWRTRGHGAIFSDYDRDGDTDMAVNLGGHPTFDQEQESRMSPEQPALFLNRLGPRANTAALMLVGTSSNRDAVGARIRVDGEETRYYTVRSMQGFQSQNSRTQLVSLGGQETARVEIAWPSGRLQIVSVRSGERITVVED